MAPTEQTRLKQDRRRTVPDVDLSAGGMETVDLVKHFKRKGSKQSVAAIDHVSLRVEPGELVVLLGPSGCGKTTILRCIAGLETPDTGQIVVNGRTVFADSPATNVPVNKRNTSVIFQGYALWPHMTVADNVGYPLQSSRGNRGNVAERVQAILDLVGVPDLGKEYPGTLSGGQQQRVSLARALVSDPPIVLFDEPLSNVDAQVRHTLRRQIKAMHRRVGFSAIYVTHDQEEALSLADRVVVLSKGKIVQVGPPEEVYKRPNSKYVAEFVGRANVFPVQVDPARAGVVTTAFGPLTVAQAPESPTPQQFAVVRPEDIAFAGDAGGGQGTVVQARVVSADFLGSRWELIVDAAGVSLRMECAKSTLIPVVDSTVELLIPAHAARVVPQ